MTEELKDMGEFEINTENTNSMEAIDPLDELVNHDFSGDAEFDINESYEMISLLERENKSAKNLEAENVITELSDIYIGSEYKQKLDKSFENVNSFFKKYNIEKDEVKNMSEDEKTKIFAVASFLSKNVSVLLNDLLFDLKLTREEYKFIYTAIERKLSYDGNEVFNIIDLNEKYLKQWKQVDNSLPKNVDTMVVSIDIKNVVMLYHFLGKHTVKGLDREFYVFASVLQKIANTNKLYNAYNVIKERLNIDFNIWAGALEPDQNMTPEIVQGQQM